MKNPKVNTSFSGYTDADFEQKAEHILASLQDNPAFSDPVPPLTTLSNAITTYSADLLAAATLDRTSVAKKNQSRLALEGILRQLGLYVMWVANGNTAILTSSGFTLSKMPEPVYITNPGTVQLSNGITSGEMEVSVPTMRGAKSYIFQISATEPTEQTEWVSTSSSRSRYTYRNLQPGKRYWVRVAVTGSGEQIAYTPVASQYVQ